MTHKQTLGLALLWLLAAGLTAQNLFYFVASWPIRDFTAFYQSTADFWRDGFLYAQPHAYINLNAPHVTVLLFTPLVWLPEPIAAWMWQAISVGCVGLSLWIVLQEVPLQHVRLTLLLALLVASCAFQHQIRQGQLGGVLMLATTFAWRASRQQKRSLPGWLALAVTLKPVLLPLVLVEWRSALRTAAIGLLGVLLGIGLCGLPNWTAWFATLGEHSVWPTPSNFGIFGTALRFSSQLKFGSTVVNSEQVLSIYELASLVVVGGSAWVTWKQRPALDRLWLIWLFAILLISPISWTYYLLVIAGPLVAWGEAHDWPVEVLIAVGLWCVPVQLVSAFWRAGAPPLGSLYTWGAFLIWSAALRTSSRSIGRTSEGSGPPALYSSMYRTGRSEAQ